MATPGRRQLTKGDPPLPPRVKRELGDAAVWSVSTAKPGNGVELLRDQNTDTFWQLRRRGQPRSRGERAGHSASCCLPSPAHSPPRSDGSQPHIITLSFPRKVELLEVALYVDVKSDESYTPRVLAVRAGTSLAELRLVRTVELDEPQGWVHLSLVARGGAPARRPPHPPPAGPPPPPPGPGVRAYVVQVVVQSNHQNGRDTHVRQVKVFGPRLCVCFGNRRAQRPAALTPPPPHLAPQQRCGDVDGVAADDGGVPAICVHPMRPVERRCARARARNDPTVEGRRPARARPGAARVGCGCGRVGAPRACVAEGGKGGGCGRPRAAPARRRAPPPGAAAGGARGPAAGEGGGGRGRARGALPPTAKRRCPLDRRRRPAPHTHPPHTYNGRALAAAQRTVCVCFL